MHTLNRRTLLATAASLALALQIGPADAQKKDIVVGVIYDYTGPFAAGGSQAAGIVGVAGSGVGGTGSDEHPASSTRRRTVGQRTRRGRPAMP